MIEAISRAGKYMNRKWINQIIFTSLKLEDAYQPAREAICWGV